MPVDQHSDPFEEELAAALRDTGDAFETDRAALATGGRARGRRIQLRRRAAVVSGAAGIALVAVGGALLLPAGSGDGGVASVGGEGRRPVASGAANTPTATGGSSPTGDPSPTGGSSPAAGSVSGDDVLSTLKSLLPGGEFSGEESRGADGEMASPYAKVVYDDGDGAAAVSVSLGRTTPGSEEARSLTQCPDKVFTPYDACTTDTLPGGARVVVFQGYEYPDRRVDTKWWHAVLVTPKGQQVSLNEWNAAAEKDAPISRPEPPLSAVELKKAVMDPRWTALVDAIPESDRKPPASAEPPSSVPGERIAGLLAARMPKGVDVVDRGGQGDFGYVVVDDGEGRSLVQINVQRDMRDVADELYGDAETLPGGTKVATRQGPGEKGGEGVVMWTVDTMREDGRRVVISAFNTGAQHEDATRDAPALSMEQLREIALDRTWETLA